MVVKTLFRQGRLFESGEAEISLLPGIPNLHIVGLPDTQIKECGIRLKAALRSSGFRWPLGQQIVVNLRPSHLRKSGTGVDLAIALGVLAETGQLKHELKTLLENTFVYGEVSLDGQVRRPHDTDRAIRSVQGLLLTGVEPSDSVDSLGLEGEWYEIPRLSADQAHLKKVESAPGFAFQQPALLDLELPESAVVPLLLALHMKLHVLLAGPQGSGKSTWAQILYSLTSEPDPLQMRERLDFFPQDLGRVRWRPFEQPHHTITTQAMVGGGLPVEPGVITRAHGGVLVMDEFLEFPGAVLEALREPLENGVIEVARKGARLRLPADFQLIATTNLCPCGKLDPKVPRSCQRTLGYCRSVCERLSGPLLDRFDLLVLTANWTRASVKTRIPMTTVKRRLEAAREFARQRGPYSKPPMDWVGELGYSYRRQRSLFKVARGLADLEESREITPFHISEANRMAVEPISEFEQVFA